MLQNVSFLTAPDASLTNSSKLLTTSDVLAACIAITSPSFAGLLDWLTIALKLLYYKMRNSVKGDEERLRLELGMEIGSYCSYIL